jgi:MFS family permease
MKQKIHWAWVILAVCFLNAFVSYGIRLGYGVVIPEMIQSIGITRTQAGTIFNTYILAYITFSPIAGNLTDRFGARRIMTIFAVVLSIGTILMGTTNQFLTAAIFFAIVGIGAAAMWNPPLTVLQYWFTEGHRGMVAGVLGAGSGLGFALAGWLFPVIVETQSWRWCWYGFGILAMLLIPLNAVLLRSKPEEVQALPWGDQPQSKEDYPKEIDIKPSFSTFLQSKVFWKIGLSLCLISFALYLVTTFLFDYINLELGFTFAIASSFATYHGLAEVVGVLSISSFSDRIGRSRALFGSNLISSLSIAGILIAGQNRELLILSVVILGAFYGAIWSLYGACSGDHFDKRIVGTVLGVWTMFYGVGSISGHLFGGWIRDTTGSFHLAFSLSVILGIAAAVLLIGIRKPARLHAQQI